jgi:hypothetical protein
MIWLRTVAFTSFYSVYFSSVLAPFYRFQATGTDRLRTYLAFILSILTSTTFPGVSKPRRYTHQRRNASFFVDSCLCLY